MIDCYFPFVRLLSTMTGSRAFVPLVLSALLFPLFLTSADFFVVGVDIAMRQPQLMQMPCLVLSKRIVLCPYLHTLSMPALLVIFGTRSSFSPHYQFVVIAYRPARAKRIDRFGGNNSGWSTADGTTTESRAIAVHTVEFPFAFAHRVPTTFDK